MSNWATGNSGYGFGGAAVSPLADRSTRMETIQFGGTDRGHKREPTMAHPVRGVYVTVIFLPDHMTVADRESRRRHTKS